MENKKRKRVLAFVIIINLILCQGLNLPAFAEEVVFSTDFITSQGSNGWSYGYFDSEYNKDRFIQFDTFSNSIWSKSGISGVSIAEKNTSISITSASKLPAKRWVCNSKINIKISGEISSDQSNIYALIYQNGAVKLKITVNRHFELDLIGLNIGDTLDFVLNGAQITGNSNINWSYNFEKSKYTDSLLEFSNSQNGNYKYGYIEGNYSVSGFKGFETYCDGVWTNPNGAQASKAQNACTNSTFSIVRRLINTNGQIKLEGGFRKTQENDSSVTYSIYTDGALKWSNTTDADDTAIKRFDFITEGKIIDCVTKYHNNSDGNISDIWVNSSPVKLASSNIQYSNIQGTNNWQYGYSTKTGKYLVSDFCGFDAFYEQDEGVHTTKCGTKAYINKDIIATEPNVFTVKRWVSKVDGDVKIKSVLEISTGNACDLYADIYLDGAKKWSITIPASSVINQSYDLEICDISLGSKLDFVVYSPRSDNDNVCGKLSWNIEINEIPKPIPSSQGDFSATQGGNNWYYGYYNSAFGYSVGKVMYLDKYSDSIGWIKSGIEDLTIGRLSMNSYNQILPVKRYKSIYHGKMRFKGKIESKQNEVYLCVYVNGVEKEKIFPNYEYKPNMNYDIELLGIKENDIIDFVLIPKDLQSNFSAELTAEGSYYVYDYTNATMPYYTPEEKQDQVISGKELLSDIYRTFNKGIKEYYIQKANYRLDDNDFLLKNIKNLDIYGSGSNLWFQRTERKLVGEPYYVNIESCENVSLRNINLDQDPPVQTQGIVKNIDSINRCFDIEIMDGFPVVEKFGSQSFFYKADGTYINQGVKPARLIEKLDANILRVYNDAAEIYDTAREEIYGANSELKIGDIVVQPFRTNRAILASNSSNLLIEDVNMYACPGFGILEEGGKGNHIYRRAKIVRRPGSNRIMASNADTFHSSMVGKGGTLDEVEFSNSGDDFINYHGFYVLTGHKYANNKYAMIPMKYNPFEIGAQLDFYDIKSVASLGTAKVIAATVETNSVIVQDTKNISGKLGLLGYSGDVYAVTLDKEIELPENCMADSNNNKSAGFLVKNSYFYNTPSMVFRVNGSADGVMINNTWRDLTGSAGIQMESWYYMEGSMNHDISIIDNRFMNLAYNIPESAYSGQGALHVGMHPAGNRMLHSKPYKNINIIGNYFKNTGISAIHYTYTVGGEVSYNTIEDCLGVLEASNSGQSFYYGEPVEFPIYVAASSDINIEGNKFIDRNGYYKRGNIGVGLLTENITVDGNNRTRDANITDTVTAYSKIQGANGWYYGYCDGVYNKSNFQLMSHIDGRDLYAIDGKDQPTINEHTYHPAMNGSNPVLAIKRWISNYDGTVIMKGRIRCKSDGGDRTTQKIYVDGKEVWSNDLTNANLKEYEFETLIKKGDMIDFVVDPKASYAYDSTGWFIEITNKEGGNGNEEGNGTGGNGGNDGGGNGGSG